MRKSLLIFTTLLFVNLPTVTTQCPWNRYGPECQYECHCALSQSCDGVMGCAGRCDTRNGWDGSTCQRQNVVLKRPVVQGPRRYCEDSQCFLSDLVVDGITGHDIYKTPCSLAESSEDKSVKAWWYVTLDQEYYISRFTLYNRMDIGEPPDGDYWSRINGFVLSVGRTSIPGFGYKDCYRDGETGDPSLIRYETCINNTPLKGNVIQVRQTTEEPLTMCELLVYVCAEGWFGEFCDRKCSTSTGCARCSKGQLSCAECVNGYWGEHCLNTCNNCPKGVGCNKTAGRCSGGECSEGFKGKSCSQTCDPGEFGRNCLSKCGYCYSGRDICTITYGICPNDVYRCEKGYSGLRCQDECPYGRWDFDCSQSCGNCRGNTGCNRTSGKCSSSTGSLICKPGYLESDPYCKQACMAGKWGDGCVFNCSENCVDNTCLKENGTCPRGCLQGYTGDRCDKVKVTMGSSSAGIIGGSVSGAMVILLIVVVGVVFWKRRHQQLPSPDVSLATMKEDGNTSQVVPSPICSIPERPKRNKKAIAPPIAGQDNAALQSDDKSTVDTYTKVNATSPQIPGDNCYECIAHLTANQAI